MYQSKPILPNDSYAFIRDLSKWNGGKINIFTPFIICQKNSGELVPASQVIGKPDVSFSLILPQAILHTTLRDMKYQDQLSAKTESYELSALPTMEHYSPKFNDVSHWHSALVSLHPRDKIELKKRVVERYREHSIHPKDGETTMEYIQRHGQRIPLDSCKRKTKVSILNAPVVPRKRQREEAKEQDKWQTWSDVSISENRGEQHKQLMKDWDAVMTDVKLPEGADLEELLEQFDSSNQFKFDDTEKETLKMMRTGKRVAPPKQLGGCITIKLDSDTKHVSCNCERCARDGKCPWVCVLEVLQFNLDPGQAVKSGNDAFGWNQQVSDARKALIKIILDP